MGKQLLYLLIVLIMLAGVCNAVLYPFQIFTSDGMYYDDPGVELVVDVTNGAGYAEFTFYNVGTVDCSLARIYFDDGSLLGIDNVFNGPGTLFDEVYPGPGNLPSGETIGFYADREFSIGAESPPPENGVNNLPAGEWVTIGFELIGEASLDDVLYELDHGILRVGVHVIAFDDGSSESAILIPEPATVSLLALGVLGLLRKRKR